MISKYIFSLIINLCIGLNSIDPSAGVEMGSKPGDCIYINGHKHQRLSSRVSNTVLIYGLQILNQILYDNSELSIFDLLIVTMSIIGTIIRYWSYYALGEFYTFKLGIRENHTIVDTGPYRYMAHPGYYGEFMGYLSLILLSPTYIGITIILIIYLLTSFLYNKNDRIKNEEMMMIAKFGENIKSIVLHVYN
jgi:protein-S-isoprenylcysteine O-methyltransferase Ste14